MSKTTLLFMAAFAVFFLGELGSPPPGLGAPSDPSDAGALLGDIPENVVEASTAWNMDRGAAGSEIILAVIVQIAEGFHINADIAQEIPAGDFDPYETKLRVVDAHPALTAQTPRFPDAHGVTAEYVEGEIFAFDGQTIFYVPFFVDATYDGADSLFATVELEYQACDDVNCLFPETQTLRAALAPAQGKPTPVEKALFANVPAERAGSSGGVGFDVFGLSFTIDASSKAGFLLLLVTAMFGGLLLNFTPCVLPVIPIKIMGLSHAAGTRMRMFQLGFVMFLGVIAFWIGLGLLIAGVSGFTATNQLFQYPVFTISVGVIIAVMAVGMTGLFFVQLPQSVYKINPGQDSIGGSFGFGIMTAILSTPCTAPFMGAAAAWAATQSSATTLATFGAIGFGMAVPYLVLSVSPGLVKRMPKTGPASELIKQVMGLLMLAAAAYFVGVGLSALLSQAPDPPSKLYWWVVMAFLAGAGFWLAFRTLQITRRAGPRILFGGLGLLLIASSTMGAVRFASDGPVDWVYYTPQRFDEALGDGRVVVMDFTAEWCLNCKSLEQSVLHASSVVDRLAEAGVVPVKVDITGSNPDGKAMLKKVGRLTIPLLVVFAPDGSEVFKSDFYTVDQVLDAVAQAEAR